MRKINKLIDELTIIVAPKIQKPSRATVLERTILYIKHLEMQVSLLKSLHDVGNKTWHN